MTDPKPKPEAWVEPTLGRIVIYRSRIGVDIAAMVTGFPPEDDGRHGVMLQLFPAPGDAGDLIDRIWGVAYSAEPAPQSWRWPERA